MNEADLYCRGCNLRFTAEKAATPCPSCGGVSIAWRDAPTIVFADTQPVAYEESDLQDDELIETRLGNYWIESFLGEGGMARVYRARHLTLERPCAIKILRPSIAAKDATAVETFLAEARSAAALVHPHVVTLHTIGNERHLHFIEMEYIDGQSLARLLDTERRVAATEATRWMVEVTSALALAHHQGMIHRDVKPGNIMVSRKRRSKLADFGLAKRRLAHVEGQGETFLVGTPHYMAPELFHGRPADARSDVYAVGVTFYCLLTGCLPVSCESVSELFKLHRGPAPIDFGRVEDVCGEAGRQLVRQCLAYDPAERYRDAEELHGEFRALYGSLRSLESLLRDALDGIPATLAGQREQWVVSVELANGRTQRVFVETCFGADTAQHLIEIYSRCGPAEESYFRRALELNLRIPHGAIAIDESHGAPQFVMCDAYPRSTCDPEELRQSIVTIAKYADQIEWRLTGRDVH